MTNDDLAMIESEVRNRIRTRGIDAHRSTKEDMSAVITEVLDSYESRVGQSRLPRVGNREAMHKRVLDSLAGYGALQTLFDDPEVEELWVNGPGRVFCARRGRHVLTDIVLSESELRDVVERMLRSTGRRLDSSSPFVDATLPDGSRLHVVIPNITRRHWAVNVRKFVLRAHRLDELVRLGSLHEVPAQFLLAAVRAGLNVLVSGGTQAGKTTMLNCLAAAIPGQDRVITCEEVFELKLDLPDVVAMQTRPASVEGTGAVDLRRLISEALRMRPDRILVGEVRGAEALDLLVALNCGLPGMTSIHANNGVEALRKMTALPLLAGGNVTHAFILPTIANSIDLVVHLSHRRGRRTTTQILAVTGRTEADSIEVASLFERRGSDLVWTGHQPPKLERYLEVGIDVRSILQ